jgi:hypothetical protein
MTRGGGKGSSVWCGDREVLIGGRVPATAIRGTTATALTRALAPILGVARRALAPEVTEYAKTATEPRLVRDLLPTRAGQTQSNRVVPSLTR